MCWSRCGDALTSLTFPCIRRRSVSVTAMAPPPKSCSLLMAGVEEAAEVSWAKAMVDSAARRRMKVTAAMRREELCPLSNPGTVTRKGGGAGDWSVGGTSSCIRGGGALLGVSFNSVEKRQNKVSSASVINTILTLRLQEWMEVRSNTNTNPNQEV